MTFTATVTSGATGTVIFDDGTTSLGTGTISSGVATLATSSLAAGTHSITAQYGGDTNYTAASSTPVSQVVNKASSTVALSSSPNPSTFGAGVTLTATVPSGATGTVTFEDNGPAISGAVPISGTTATFADLDAVGGFARDGRCTARTRTTTERSLPTDADSEHGNDRAIDDAERKPDDGDVQLRY